MAVDPDYRLSPNFTFGELTDTSRTAYLAANRAEAEKYLRAGEALAKTILQPIRDKWGPLQINSGFRSVALNKVIGSRSATSQHLLFEAADIVPLKATIPQVFDWIRKESKIPFGQLIDERMGNGWIHISLGAPWRSAAQSGQVLRTLDGKSYTPVK